MSYESLAGRYDALTKDVDHQKWADYLEHHIKSAQVPVETVLDLACGTGTMTCIFAERGYEMIGVDLSAEMLSQAMEKGFNVDGQAPMFLNQPMEELDLYGTIDACICCLDSVNYVTSPADLRRAFQRVHLFMMPGGVFIFDINSPGKLKGIDGGTFIDETEDTYCVWRADYDKDTRICTYGMDLFFHTKDGQWSREGELHEEYAYEPEELITFLREAGFKDIAQFGELSMEQPKENEQRIFFVARKEL